MLMKTTKLLLTAACCLTTCCVSAQTIGAVDEQGRQVRRITFDREQVTVEYVDGDVRNNVDFTLVTREEMTGIETVRVNSDEQSALRQVYDLQGRPVGDVNNLSQGIYVVREGEKVYKLIKK